jgi:hypothetical protein
VPVIVEVGLMVIIKADMVIGQVIMVTMVIGVIMMIRLIVVSMLVAGMVQMTMRLIMTMVVRVAGVIGETRMVAVSSVLVAVGRRQPPLDCRRRCRGEIAEDRYGVRSGQCGDQRTGPGPVSQAGADFGTYSHAVDANSLSFFVSSVSLNSASGKPGTRCPMTSR